MRNRMWRLSVSVLLLGVLSGCSGGQEEPVKETETTTVFESEHVETAAQRPLAADGSRILFIGNSHTYVNDLPGTFDQLAKAGGHEVEVHEVTNGGYSLEQFADPEDEYGALVEEALTKESWDFVVLQENTNAAVDGEKRMYPYARELDAMIEKAGAQTVFLMTWTPKDGVPGFSRKMVQSVLSDNYTKIAGELDALLIPGGDLFLAALNQNPGFELWDEDGQHPGIQGTYLASCGAYALLFGETPAGNPYLGELDEKTAGELQNASWDYMQGLD